MDSDLVKVQDVGGGGAYTIDEYNHTVRYHNGKVVDFREVDWSLIQDQLDPWAKRDITVSNVHVNTALANFLVGYGSQMQDAIADIVCPPFLVDKASNTFFTVSANDKFRDVDSTLASESDPVKEVGPNMSTDTYNTVAYGLGTFIPQGVVANADAVVMPMVRALSRVMNAMTIAREKRVYSALTNSTTFTGYTTTLTSSNFWDTYAGTPTASDPVANIYIAKESMLKPCTHIVMSEKTWHRFVGNPNVAKYSIYGSTDAQALARDPQELARRMGMPEVQFVISRMRTEATTAGVTTKSYLWADYCTLLSIPPGADTNGEQVPTARTFRWDKNGAARQFGGFRIREWEDPSRGQDGGRKLAVLCNDHEKVVAAPTGHVIINCW